MRVIEFLDKSKVKYKVSQHQPTFTAQQMAAEEHEPGKYVAKPVIGVLLISAGGLEGIDALLSTIQMPPGVPVATMAIGKAGAKNTAIFAVQILALTDKNLAKKLAHFKKTQQQKVVEKDSAPRSCLPPRRRGGTQKAHTSKRKKDT
jgi:5-(carboxyamino)imidazole ribonucleotide mutase